jgi:phospholipase C
MVTLAVPKSVTASFGPITPVHVSLSGAGSGTVVSTPAGINCPGTCTASFSTGSSVTLTAAATGQDAFANWSGGCAGTTNTCTVTADPNALPVNALFGKTLQSAINHIVFMAQENRGFEHYFGAMRGYWAQSGGKFPDQPFNGLPQFNPAPGPVPTNKGCDPNSPPPADCDITKPTSPDIQSFHPITKCLENPSPSWNEDHVDMNYYDDSMSHTSLANAKLDGFVWTAAHDARNLGFFDTDGIRAMAYYDWTDLPFYYYMASSFATSDTWFSPAMTRTQPNRMYSLAATSQGHAYPIPSGGSQLTSPTIFDLLHAKNISWKAYVTDLTYATPPVQDSSLNMFASGNQYQSTNVRPVSEFVTDMQNGTLPSVSYIEPGLDSGLDEHPGIDDMRPGAHIQVGANFVRSLITQLMNSPSWKDTVFILTFDEFGGFYDHVSPQVATYPDPGPMVTPTDLLQPPPAGNGPDVCVPPNSVGPPTGPNPCYFEFTGYRVPLIVVSPYTRANYVSHTQADYTAWLKLVETRFGLGNLTARDAAQMDMTEFFDFVNEPWKTPPSPSQIPPQPTNGMCYVDHLP